MVARAPLRAEEEQDASSSDSPSSGQEQPARSSNFVPAVGNFSIQYNFTSASIAVGVISDESYLGHPLVKEPGWSSDVTLTVVFVGAMVGMLSMGRLGDVIGRARALQVTLVFTVLGALIPACAFGDGNSLYGILCFGRLVLGIGVGGIYPLSAVHSAEGCDDHAGRGKRVAQAFFFQSVGVIAPYVVCMLLLAVLKPATPADWVPQLQFRLLFALGAVPAAVVFFASLREKDSPEYTQDQDQHSGHGGVAESFRKHPELLRTLAGTAGTWFLFDVAFYGTSIFTPQILDAVCLYGRVVDGKCQQSLFETAELSALVSVMGIPGSVCAILLVPEWGSKRLNVYGFAALSVVFALMAITMQNAPGQHGLLFVLFCVLRFFLNFGPNLGTYVLPAICFPAFIRSTCHGLSATGGKLGAVTGSLLFDPISNSSAGITGVLWVQAVTCALGVAVAQLLQKHDWEYSAAESIADQSLLGTGTDLVSPSSAVEVSPRLH
ncbi:unnamed protein product [Polarella glacialis]|uniref:Major facilitator superfamily (MFS) profile domain-containing protein n=1 Tax=Polarella glacialis TaxID=89957 RepID=A0A813HWU2_POLGL|nr:unnamed protein product [Polarella glacialis]